MLQTTCAVQAGTSGGAVVQRCSGELLGKEVLQEESHVHLLNRGGHMITTENVSVQGKVSCAYISGSVSTAVALNSQKKCFFVVLQGSFPATRETWPLKWLTHIWTSASQWLFSRDCCSTLSRQRMLMYSGSWTVQKKKSGGCGDYKVLRANCNRGPLHYTDTWYRWQIRMN